MGHLQGVEWSCAHSVNYMDRIRSVQPNLKCESPVSLLRLTRVFSEIPIKKKKKIISLYIKLSPASQRGNSLIPDVFYIES